MLNRNLLSQAVALALILPGVALAEIEISGEVKIEASVFTSDGQLTGADDEHESGDAMKTEGSVRLFINTDIGEESAIHAELLLADDGEAPSERLEIGEQYSQYEILRELYLDTTAGEWDLRLGKQQVVWGTADGIKLLDVINPTDFRELNQNTTEDARIPIWMINAEKTFDDGSNFQLIISEVQRNFISGLGEPEEAGTGTDAGAPFIFKGVDTITGTRNGFLNIAPALGATAAQFVGFASAAPIFGAVFSQNTDAFGPGSAVDDFSAATDANSAFGVWGAIVAEGNFGPDANGDFIPDALQPASLGQAGGGTFTVQNFIDGQSPFCAGGSPQIADDIAAAGGAPSGSLGSTCAEMLNNIAQGFAGNNGVTNLVDSVYDSENPDSAFEFMNQATFATFDTFAGITTEYRVEDPDEEFNIGARYKNTTDSGLNFSINALYSYDPNPVVSIQWEDSAGNVLTANEVATPSSLDNNQNGTIADPTVPADLDPIYGEFPAGSAVVLFNDDGSVYDKATNGPAQLTFVETQERVTNIGGSFDVGLDGTSIPTVIRGEFLYTADVNVPVIDRNKLAIGDITGALKPIETDFFKYVLGVDITVATNLLISTQLIQFFNLDFIDENTDANGVKCATANCGRYTGDPSTLSLTNNLQKGDEIETFVSIFLSKPFGAEQQHRWNNIIIAENEGGYWNRFDVEYSFIDELIGTFELNNYWGDEDTTFGQFKDSSNLQLGLKYLF